MLPKQLQEQNSQDMKEEHESKFEDKHEENSQDSIVLNLLTDSTKPLEIYYNPSEKAYSPSTTYYLLKELQELKYDPEEVFSADTELIKMLNGIDLSKLPKDENRKDSKYITDGIQSFFRKLHGNEPVTSAPSNEDERKEAYTTLAKGLKLITDILKEKVEEKKEGLDIYSFLELIGDAGNYCYQRWNEVLETLAKRFSNEVIKKTNIHIQESQNKLNDLLKELFCKSREIVAENLACDFMKEYYPNQYEGNIVHYKRTFKQILNDAYGFNLAQSQEHDPFLDREIAVIQSHAGNFLSKRDIHDLVLTKFTTLFNEAVKGDSSHQNTPLFEEIINWANYKILNGNGSNLNNRYPDLMSFMFDNIFVKFDGDDEFTKSLLNKQVRSSALRYLLEQEKLISSCEDEPTLMNRVNRDDLTGYNKLNQKVEKCTPLHIELYNKGKNYNKDLIRNILEKSTIKNLLRRNSEGKDTLDLAEEIEDKGIIEAVLKRLVVEKDDALICASYNGHKEIVKMLLDKSANVNQLDKYGNTALIHAAIEGNKEIVQMLLDKSADINQENKYENTALMFAARNGHKEIVQMLLDKGADVNQVDKYGHTALIHAAIEGNKEIVQMLLDKSTIQSLFEKNDKGINALDLVFKTENKEIIDLVFKRLVTATDIEKGIIISKWADENGHKEGINALNWAAKNGYKEIVQILLDKGADVNQVDISGNIALIHAAVKGYKEIVKMLLDKGADVNQVNQVDKYGHTALIHAAIKGYKEIVQMLLDKSTIQSLFEKNDKGINALDLVFKTENKEIIDLVFKRLVTATDIEKGIIISKWADENGHKEGINALNWAAKNGYKEIVQILLYNGTDVNKADISGDTALIYAALTVNKKIVQILIDKGADVNKVNRLGNTALIAATHKGHKDIVQMLLDKSTIQSLFEKNNEGINALDLVINTENKEIIDLAFKRLVTATDIEKGIIISKWADENGYKEGINALNWAAKNGYKEIVQILIDNGTDVNQVDKYGNPAFSYAVVKGNKEMVQMLLDKGADVNQLDYLYYLNDKNITELVINLGASLTHVNLANVGLTNISSENQITRMKSFADIKMSNIEERLRISSDTPNAPDPLLLIKKAVEHISERHSFFHNYNTQNRDELGKINSNLLYLSNIANNISSLENNIKKHINENKENLQGDNANIINEVKKLRGEMDKFDKELLKLKNIIYQYIPNKEFKNHVAVFDNNLEQVSLRFNRWLSQISKPQKSDLNGTVVNSAPPQPIIPRPNSLQHNPVNNPNQVPIRQIQQQRNL